MPIRDEKLTYISINKVSIDPTQTDKRNKEYNKVGIQAGGIWYNSIVYDGEFLDKLKASEGGEIQLTIYEEEYNGKWYKKFKRPSKVDELSQQVEILQGRVDKSSRVIGDLIKRIEALEK